MSYNPSLLRHNSEAQSQSSKDLTDQKYQPPRLEKLGELRSVIRGDSGDPNDGSSPAGPIVG